MTNKEIATKLNHMIETYIELREYAKVNYDHDAADHYDIKVQAVNATALHLLGNKYFEQLKAGQKNYAEFCHQAARADQG